MAEKPSYTLQRILWATDFSAESRHCLQYVDWISRNLKTQNHALYVLPKFSDWVYEAGALSDDDLQKEIASERAEALQKIAAVGKQKNLEIIAAVAEGAASEEIMNYSVKHDIDMILAGRRGISPLEQLLIGSTTSRLIRNSGIPVMVVPEKARTRGLQRLMIPVDISDSGMSELKYALDIASQMKAELIVLHVAEFFNYKVPVLKMDKVKDRITKTISKLAEDSGYPIADILFETGEPAHKIIESAGTHDVDMIIMTSHQRSGIEKLFLGSVTEKMLMATEVPLLVLPFSFISS